MREIEIRKRSSGYFLPAAFLRAAHLAFIASESFFLPAAVSPPFFFPFAAPPPVPLRRAQRALAAVASFARVAADIGRRRRRRRRMILPELAAPAELLAPPPPKSVDNWRSSVSICCLIESAFDSLLRDRSMGS